MRRSRGGPAHPLAAGACVALLAVVACGGSGVEADAAVGTLSGTISVGPFCPVEIEGQECRVPPGTYESIRVLVYAPGLGGRLVADARPDTAGRFTLALPSGTYRVVLEHPLGIPGGPAPEREARVEAGATTALAFDIDTGIR